MEAIPGFSTAVKTFLRIGYEEYLHGVNMASKIRLSEKQLPELYHKLPPICKKLGIAEPDFYLEMNPSPNAYTFGDTHIFLTVTSGLVEYLNDCELDAVLAHECGHIACRHVLYHTMANLLKMGADAFGLLGVFTTPVQLALLYWSRLSELSADRAAAVVTGSAKPVVETMIRLAGGPIKITEKVDIAEYAAQADAYEVMKEKKWDKILQTVAIAYQDHPFTSVRTKEIIAWCNMEYFTRLVEKINIQEDIKICPNCQNPINKEWKFCKSCGNQL
jgi:Zn-dependent protease with chaperone function